MKQMERVTFTNMCMVRHGDRVLVQDRKNPDWPGITFPGGHVEPGESFTEAVIREVWEDRKALEEDYGVIVRGMAYANGAYNDEVISALRMCGICYSRTTVSTCKYTFPENWLALHPTCHHNNPKLMELADKFVNGVNNERIYCKMFYVWGHSYEFDNDDNWSVMEALLKFTGGRDDIWYATNIEIYDYVKAYQSLIVSLDGRTVTNPTATDVWFSDRKQTYCVRGGQTVRI